MAEGKKPLPDLREGIRTLAILEAMDQSIKTKQVVKISEILKKRNIEL